MYSKCIEFILLLVSYPSHGDFCDAARVRNTALYCSQQRNNSYTIENYWSAALFQLTYAMARWYMLDIEGDEP